MKKKITFLIGMLISLAFVGCSSDNEPEADSKAQEEYNLILGIVTTPDGEIVFQNIAGDPAERGMVVYGEAESKQFCEVLLRGAWNGKNTTRTLPGGYGSLSISKSDEDGVFHIVKFNLKGYAPFTLKLATAEYFNSDNAAVVSGGFKRTRYWKCNDCGYMRNGQWGIPHPCPSCKKDYDGQWTSILSGTPPLI